MPRHDNDDDDDGGDGDGLPQHHPSSSSNDHHHHHQARQHFINVIKSWVGSNFLSLPFAFAAFGTFVGPLAVAVVALVSCSGCLLLVQIRKDLLLQQQQQHQQEGEEEEESRTTYKLQQQRQQQQQGQVSPHTHTHDEEFETYPQVAGHVLGRFGYLVVNFLLAITQWGYCCGYTIYMTTALHQVTQTHSPHPLSSATIIFGILTPLLIFLCLVPDLKRFLPFSLLSNLALLVGFLAVFFASLSHVHTQGTFQIMWGVDMKKVPLAFGNLVASFEGIGTILPVEGCMAKDGGAHVREFYPLYLKQTLVGLVVAFSVFGIVGFGGWGRELCSVILTNLPEEGKGCVEGDVARVAMVVGLFFTCK